MSGDPTTAAERDADPDPDAPRPSRLAAAAGAVPTVRAPDPRWVVPGAGLAALLAVAGRTLLLVLYNLPFDPVVVGPAVRALVADGTTVVVAVALVAVAVAAGRPAARVGLLFAGTFGLLTVLSPAATLPAAVAVTAGGGLAVLVSPGWPSTYRAARRRGVALVLVAGVALSLSGAVGLLDGGLRAAGGPLALVGVAAVGVRAGGDPVASLAGGLAFGAVVVASLASPFVVGSALLVGFAVVGVPHLLVALAAAGGTAAAVGGVRRGDYGLAVGASLLLLAGVPGTVTRALAVVLAVALAVIGVGTLAPRPADATGEVAP